MSQQVRRDFTDDFKREAVRLTKTSATEAVENALSTLTASQSRQPSATRFANPTTMGACGAIR